MQSLILSNIAKHISLTDDEKAFFTSLLITRFVKRKEVLLQEGEINNHQIFVTKGCLRTYYRDEAGKEHIIMFAPENWWAGDMHSFLTGKKAVYTIDALEKSEVILISKANIEKLYDDVPKFERFFRILFQNAFVVFHGRVAGNLSGTALQRYKRFIKTYPGLEQRIAQKYIASYLGVTPEFFSGMRLAAQES